MPSLPELLGGAAPFADCSSSVILSNDHMKLFVYFKAQIESVTVRELAKANSPKIISSKTVSTKFSLPSYGTMFDSPDHVAA